MSRGERPPDEHRRERHTVGGGEREVEDREPPERRRRGPMSRIGDLIPDAAARLGLGDELRRARAVAAFDRIVAERAPAAHGACRAVRVDGSVLIVEADAPIVAQELRLHSRQLAEAFRTAPAGSAITEIRVTVRPRGSSSER